LEVLEAENAALRKENAELRVKLDCDRRRCGQFAAQYRTPVGLLSMFGFSAAYNTWPVSAAKRVLRRFDHSAIFLMIAGTYTPFIAQMNGNLVAMGLLAGVWLTAVVGIILKLLLPGRFDRLAVVLYLLLGWSGAVVYEPVMAALPSLGIWLLAAGGALYSMGVVFYAWRSCDFKMRSGMPLYWLPQNVLMPCNRLSFASSDSRARR
jgi:channel protein (hemolysin III family)